MATRYVDPDAAAGGDGTTNALSGANCAYVSLNAWEAARQAVLSEPEVCICGSAHANHTADVTATTIDGWTPSASNYISVADAAALATKWNDARYRLTPGAGYTPLTIAESYTRIGGLQILASGSSNYRNGIEAGGASAGVLIVGCIVRCTSTGNYLTGINVVSDAVGGAQVINNLVVGWKGTNSTGISGSSTAGSFGINVFHNTVYDCRNGIGGPYGDVKVTNCAIFGCTDDIVDQGFDIDNCATDDGDGTNHVHLNENAGGEWAAAFTNYSNGDFSVKNASSPLYDAGLDLAGVVTTDIVGTTRTRWDIGAHEYAVVGAVPLRFARRFR